MRIVQYTPPVAEKFAENLYADNVTMGANIVNEAYCLY